MDPQVNGTYTEINVSISNGKFLRMLQFLKKLNQCYLHYVGGRRRRRNIGITSIIVNSAYATQGSVIGVYFEPSQFPLSVIGSLPASPYEDLVTCKLPGNRRTTSIDCQFHMVTDLVVLASATICKH